MRTELPNCRYNESVTVEHGHKEYVVTFGFDHEMKVREVFLSSGKTGTDMTALLTDAAICLSLLLQSGIGIAELCLTLSEDRPEGEKRGPPASVLGAIARMGALVEADPLWKLRCVK